MTATLIDLTERRAGPQDCAMPLAKSHVGLELDALIADEVLIDLRIAPFLRNAHETLALHPNLAAFEQIGTECHYRFDFADQVIVGHGEVCAVAEGVLLQVCDAEARRPRVLTMSCPEVLRIRIGLEGSERLAREGEPTVLTEGPMALVVAEPAGQAPAHVVFSGRQSTVMLAIDREALQQLWRGRERELPELVQAFLAGRLTQTAYRRLSLKSDLLRCLEDLQRCEQDGFARTLLMRSKGFEILCHILRMLAVDESFGGADASLSTSKGVLRAQQILKQRYVEPPSLDDLAREVGVSRSSLCAGFRQIVGQSIGSYIQELRMERALELLATSAEPITEVAYKVGYCHQSSFTVAVQRRFGMSPSELRRNARSPEG